MSTGRLNRAPAGTPHDDEKGERDRVAARLSELEALFRQRVDQAMLRDARISQLERALDSATNQVGEVKSGADPRAAYARELEAQLSSAKAERDSLQRHLERQLNEATAHLAEHSLEVDHLKVEIRDGETNSADLRAQVAELEALAQARQVAMEALRIDRDSVASELLRVKKRAGYVLVEKTSRALRSTGPLFGAARWLVRRLAK